jgi:hypothetical protein
MESSIPTRDTVLGDVGGERRDGARVVRPLDSCRQLEAAVQRQREEAAAISNWSSRLTPRLRFSFGKGVCQWKES